MKSPVWLKISVGYLIHLSQATLPPVLVRHQSESHAMREATCSALSPSSPSSPGVLSPQELLGLERIERKRGLVGIDSGGSVQFSRSVVSDSLQLHEAQHTRPPCPSPSPRVHSDSSPLSQWCHPAISSSVIPLDIVKNTKCKLKIMTKLFNVKWLLDENYS